MKEWIMIGYPTRFSREVILRGDRSGEIVWLRPACELDIAHIIAYLKRMSDEERYLRYMCEISTDALTKISVMKDRYVASLDYVSHMAFVVIDKQGNILGVSHAFGTSREPDEEGRYLVSYSRDSSARGTGVGTALMEGLIAWGDAFCVKGFYADTLRENHRMVQLFKDFGFACISPHPDGGGFDRVRFRLDLHVQ